MSWFLQEILPICSTLKLLCILQSIFGSLFLLGVVKIEDDRVLYLLTSVQ